MRSYSSEGVVLARRSFGEADRILILLTRDFGRLSFIAKGVRKVTSRKRGHIEVFSHIKFHASKGKGIDLMTEAETVEGFGKVRDDLKRVAVGYFFLEVVGKVTREAEPHEELFDLLLEYLRKLEETSSLRQLRNEFTQRALTSVGFWPEGKRMDNPDYILENVAEKKITSIRVGKKLFS